MLIWGSLALLLTRQAFNAREDAKGRAERSALSTPYKPGSFNDPTGMVFYPTRPVSLGTLMDGIGMVAGGVAGGGLGRAVELPAMAAGISSVGDNTLTLTQAFGTAVQMNAINPRKCSYCHYWANHLKEANALWSGQVPVSGAWPAYPGIVFE